MNYLAQVQKGVDYIEAHLDHDIQPQQVAAAAGLSRWHFQRIFKGLCNETLKTYIRSRRLANSLDKLLRSDERIIDIALAAGFESQQSFSRAFKQAFSLNPAEYRRLGDKTLFLKKAQFNTDYLQHLNRGVSLQPQIIEQAPLKMVGMTTQFFGVDSEKNNIADKLPPLWDQFLQLADQIPYVLPGPYYGVVQQVAGDSDLLQYHSTAVVEKFTELPEGMVSFELPACTYACFSHRGEVAKVNDTVNYIYSSWLLASGYRHSYAADLEIYGDEYAPDSDQSLIHYAIPVLTN